MSAPKKGLYVLPSLFTVSSIFCGFLAMVLAVNAQGAEEIHRSALLIALAMILDGFDGRVARMTNTQSNFGVQLDSLADVISFGVAPAVIVYQFALKGLGFFGVFAAFCFIACGAIRLARFNVQAAETGGASRYFTGLPIPAAAGLVASFLLVMTGLGHAVAPPAAVAPAAVMTLALGGLMVSNVRYKTFKKVRVVPHEQALLAFVFVIFAIGAVQWGGAIALTACLAFYVVMGLFGAMVGVGRRGIHAMVSRIED